MNRIPLLVALLLAPPRVLRADTGATAPQTAAAGNASNGIFLPDAPLPGRIEYINPNPPEFAIPEYDGERYEALVPATLDLAERARMVLHAMTSMTNPNINYEQYFTVTHMSQPPAMEHSPSDMHCLGKFMESTVLMRLMCGSRENMNVERAWMESALKMQGPDGLIYTPTTGRSWILLPTMDVASGSAGTDTFTHKHFCLVGFGTARMLAALSMYAQLDPAGPWAASARRLAHAYDKLMIHNGDKAYLFSTWMYPGRPFEIPEKHPFDEYLYLAACQAWIAQYLAMYDRAVNDPQSSALAREMMRYNILEKEVLEPSGRFKPSKGIGAGPGLLKGQYSHFHTQVTNILACLYAYMQTGDEELLDRAVKAYEWGKTKSEPLVGFFPMVTYDEYIGAQVSETCEVADMVIAGVILSRLGIDRWDDVDRWVRNQLAENQLTWTAWLTDGHLDYSRSQTPDGFFASQQRTTDRVIERTLGAFAGWPAPNDWVGAEDWEGGDKQKILYTVMNCCTASGARALYSAWRDMLEWKDGTLRVHLLLNRASKWADIDSFVPYAGRVEVKAKTPLNLELRIPDWVAPEQVRCAVDGKERAVAFAGRYAKTGKVNKGQTIAFDFPIAERTEKRRIEGFDYTFIVRGNDVVAVDPPGKYCPLYQRGHYREGVPLFQRVTRFVARDEINWS